jgi:hypothetical protein
MAWILGGVVARSARAKGFLCKCCLRAEAATYFQPAKKGDQIGARICSNPAKSKRPLLVLQLARVLGYEVF